MMVFMNLTFLIIVMGVGLLLFYGTPHFNLVTDPTRLAGPYLSYESWFTSIDSWIQSGYVGLAIFQGFLSNAPLLWLINFSIVVLSIRYWRLIGILNKYVDDKKKVIEKPYLNKYRKWTIR